jgi:hypothetical protein
MPGSHHRAQPRRVDEMLEQLLQRLVVEQRARAGAPPAGDHPADRHHRQPARTGADHADRVRAIDLLGAEVLPDVDEAGDRLVEAVGAAGERCGVDRAGRRPGDHRERIAAVDSALAPDLGDRLQHADLIGGACAPAGQYQAGARLLR